MFFAKNFSIRYSYDFFLFIYHTFNLPSLLYCKLIIYFLLSFYLFFYNIAITIILITISYILMSL